MLSADKSWPTFLVRYFILNERFLCQFFICTKNVHHHKMDISSGDKSLTMTTLFLHLKKRKKKKFNNVGETMAILGDDGVHQMI